MMKMYLHRDAPDSTLSAVNVNPGKSLMDCSHCRNSADIFRTFSSWPMQTIGFTTLSVIRFTLPLAGLQDIFNTVLCYCDNNGGALLEVSCYHACYVWLYQTVHVLLAQSSVKWIQRVRDYGSNISTVGSKGMVSRPQHITNVLLI